MEANFAKDLPDRIPDLGTILFGAVHLIPPNGESEAPRGAIGAVDKKHPHALLVDDAPDVLEMLAFLFRHEGYEVVTADSAFVALEAAKSQHFDVIVSDIGMPGMDGYSLASALRAMPQYKRVPLVAVTGFSMYDDRDRAVESGFDAHLTKPINPITLLELLERLREKN
jgi:two-component system CheB/CheR fusion protein